MGVCAAYLDFMTGWLILFYILFHILSSYLISHLISLIISYILLFKKGTIPDVIDSLSPSTTTWVILPFLLLLAYLRTFKLLSFTSILGDIAVTIGILAVIMFVLIRLPSNLISFSYMCFLDMVQVRNRTMRLLTNQWQR